MKTIFQSIHQQRNGEIKKCLAALERKIRNCTVVPIPEMKLSQIIDSLSKEMSCNQGGGGIAASDVTAFAANAQTIYLGEGIGKGNSMAEDATCAVITNLNCESAFSNISSAIVLIVGSPDTTLEDVEKIAATIQEKMPDNATTMLSMSFDATLNSELHVTAILAVNGQK